VISPQGHLESTSQFPPLGLALEGPNWYAVYTKARHRKRVAAHFEEETDCAFSPTSSSPKVERPECREARAHSRIA